ncbi:aspartate aminotransferase family protein [Gordonia sp. zg691]|uniref:Aspartate aminotransferase family protein n=1 Tax=Gordonia jinghuaiqii TaxID=2758710 RepID=A0A7D7LX08_9ACTN|nr:aspartate aminotransferase family protein [Gordonia jinghuaiqii]MBD0861953.1 aspartate aminotransferase family protein [Gordonia jinghuaiqii]MCR5977858.1 aminotransferase class III-fold pyridoxal phosphate-dependent enzyme [Gordonia jinghuaiqii]QMT02515.1 aspartate aminotransferase family protein [Gordonia jinghuaiqii]
MSKPVMVNAYDPADADRVEPRTRKLIERREDVLGPGYRLFYREPLAVERGEGAHLFDADGNDYLDVYNNVPSVGHCHPHVVGAVHAQMQRLNTNTRYVQESLVAYSERLVATFPDELNRVTFTCTGSEANDLALRVARYHTGNQGVIVTEGAYHGLTSEVAAFSPSLGIGSPLGSHVRTIKAPDQRLAPGSMQDYMRDQIRGAIADLQRHGYGLAAFFADSIFSSDGVFSDPAGFLQPIVEEVHNAGGLYVADEVQPGFCRLGESWWGFQRHGITPDLVTIGKPMGNGIPVAAVIFRSEVTEDFGRNVRYFNTFGGSSVPIAAANAVLDVIEQEGLQERARTVGATLRSGIEEVLAPYDAVAEVRGIGYFLGVDIVDAAGDPDPVRAADLVNDLRNRRVLISASGPDGNVLKIRPPLAFSAADADRFLTELAAAGPVLKG